MSRENLECDICCSRRSARHQSPRCGVANPKTLILRLVVGSNISAHIVGVSGDLSKHNVSKLNKQGDNNDNTR